MCVCSIVQALARTGSATVLKLFLDSGASAREPGPNHTSALVVAAIRGDVDVVRVLLADEADVDGEVDCDDGASDAEEDGKSEVTAMLCGCAHACDKELLSAGRNSTSHGRNFVRGARCGSAVAQGMRRCVTSSPR